MKRVIPKSRPVLYHEFKSKIGKLRILDSRRAKRLAATTKRLDVCSAQIAHVFHLSGFAGESPLRGKTCVEIGSGWVLSHALVLYLLGAAKVIATDVQRVANPAALYQSIHSSAISIVRDILSPFEDHSLIRTRVNRLLTIKTFSYDVLKDLGIEYVAPVDLTKGPLNLKTDFVFSFSVLEHVPASDVLLLLENLTRDLSVEGKMIHCIHLEDHRDISNAPFDFLSEPGEKFSREVQCTRGNRLRCSQWSAILSQVKGMEFRFIYEWTRSDKKLPTIIDPSINYIDDEDLTVSHIGILGKKMKI